MSIRDRLRPVFVRALEVEPDCAVEELEHRGHHRWDSIGHLALVAAIEDEFDVELDTDQLIGMTTFDRAVETLRDLGVPD